jgi:hypothetical protein
MGTESGYDGDRLQALGSYLEGCFSSEIDDISPDMTRLMLILSHVPPARPDAERLAGSKKASDKSVSAMATPAKSSPNARSAIRKWVGHLSYPIFGKVK